MENQHFDNLPLDSSRQVGDQFLISGSPQTRFCRIGEWASGNLQPWYRSLVSYRTQVFLSFLLYYVYNIDRKGRDKVV